MFESFLGLVCKEDWTQNYETGSPTNILYTVTNVMLSRRRDVKTQNHDYNMELNICIKLHNK